MSFLFDLLLFAVFLSMLNRVKDVITQVLQTEENIQNIQNFSKSRNYKLKMPVAGTVETNVIFNSDDYMPKEIMLATTLDILNTDLLEVLHRLIC